MSQIAEHLTCINCPLGCALEVILEDGEAISVTGNTCPRGEAYGKKEVTNPTRVVTSTVRVKDGVRSVVSGKTKEDIPKDAIFSITDALTRVEVTAPVHIGDILVKDIANTGVDFVATADIEAI